MNDFAPAQCVAGGSWVVRNDSFFVSSMWEHHNFTLDTSVEETWENCAKKCEAWTVDKDQPLKPCAMWTWADRGMVHEDGRKIPARTCLLAQGGGPTMGAFLGFMSGCQYGSVCNQTLPGVPVARPSVPGAGSLLEKCKEVHARAVNFARNYTTLLVGLPNTFNGAPDKLEDTLGFMYSLKYSAIDLMETPDPRIRANTMGVGPPWQYIASASQYEARGRVARPIPT